MPRSLCICKCPDIFLRSLEVTSKNPHPYENVRTKIPIRKNLSRQRSSSVRKCPVHIDKTQLFGHFLTDGDLRGGHFLMDGDHRGFHSQRP